MSMKSKVESDDDDDVDTLGVNRDDVPNRGGVALESCSVAVSTLSSMTANQCVRDLHQSINNTAIIANQNTNIIGLTGQISSRPGAYRMEGPNINFDHNDIGSFGLPLIDVHENNNNNDITSNNMNGTGGDGEPLIEATPVRPIEATIVPLYEGVIVADLDEEEVNLESSNSTHSDASKNNDEISTSLHTTNVNGRNRTQVLEDMIMQAVVESDRSSSHNSHQLDLDDIKLYGREVEMMTLKTKLLELKKRMEEDGSKELVDTLPDLVLISGISGTGKSSLVMKGIKEPAAKLGITFVSGKFDQNNSSMPLSAFVDAMLSLTNLVIGSDRGYKIQHEINETFREEEILLLAKTLPGCEVGLFPMQREEIYRKRASQYGSSKVAIGNEARLQYETMTLMGKSAITCLHNKIRRLLQIICKHLQGVVLFIDDLQWSDKATVDLLQSISLDSSIPSLLVVGAYRSDEVPDPHPLLALQIHEREEMGTVISIGNLTLKNTTTLVAEALDIDEDIEEIRYLGFIVQKKTRGNAFFVLMFLRSLYDDKLLKYDFVMKKWTWNNAEVDRLHVSENVACLLINKLSRLGEPQKNILKISGSLGGCFAKSIICIIVTSLAEQDTDQLSWHETLSSLDQSIDELEKEGIWEKNTDTENVWRFSHDKIQLVAFELIPPNDRDSFRGKIGNILMSKLDSEELDANLFEVVSLCNFAMYTISDEGERIELAKMNLRAGLKASGNTAFDSAVSYFKAGRAVLGPNGWSIDQRTMLKLSSEGANACFISGDPNTMHELITEVINRQDISMVDKFSVTETKIQAAYAKKELNEAIDIIFSFRQQLGLPILKNKPASPLIIVKEFVKTKNALGKRTAEDIASLPDLTDDRIIMGQRMLELACTSSFQVQPTMFPLIVFLLVRATLKYGINASSCDAFGSLSLLLCGPFGKVKKGQEMHKAVDLILAKPGMGMDRMKSRSILVYEGVVHHWFAPLQDTLGPLLEGYQVGLRTGDVESACNNMGILINHLYYAGHRPLGDILIECRSMMKVMSQLNQIIQQLTLRRLLLQLKKLSGADIGEVTDMSWEDIKKVADDSGNKLHQGQIFTGRLELTVFFQEWEDATSLLLEAGDLRPALRGIVTMPRYTFCEGLISIHAAQVTTTPWIQKRKWKKRALKSAKLIRGMVKRGNVNLVHCLHLLEAELAVLDGKNEKAEANYKSAIDAATTNGFVQDRALSHELASAYFAKKGDEYWRDYHMEQCQNSYLDWGAYSKVEALRNAIETNV